ncbi:MAG: arsenate reductase [Rickettsiales bacterium]|jgi:arsenate reductase
MITIYGIKNCSTVKKALNWLDENGIKYHFSDYKKEGANKEKLRELVKKFGWQKIANSKGMTWKKLEDNQKPTDEKSAIAIMMEKTSIIKRPIIDDGENQIIGFDPDEYKKIFKSL